jgi:hypothetical protein
MKKYLAVAAMLLLWASLGQAQTLTATQASIHVGENATVCGTISDRHVATHSQGMPTFIDLEKPYPNQPFTILVWARDKAKVGSLPMAGQFCVTGQIGKYRGGAQIVLHNASSWYVPKSQSAPLPPQLSNDNHYTNSDGRQVHSPAYSSRGVPAGATAVCGDGTYSFSQHRSGTCSHHGGVARWL